MNYKNIITYPSMDYIEKAITDAAHILKLKSKRDRKKILAEATKHIYMYSYSNEIFLENLHSMVCNYIDENNEVKTIDGYEILFKDSNLKIDDLYNKDDKPVDKAAAYSIQFLYYFELGNLSKAVKVIKNLINEKDVFVGLRSLLSVPYISNDNVYEQYKKYAYLKLLCVLYACKDHGTKIKSLSDVKCEYFSMMKSCSKTIRELFKDPFIKLMHRDVVKKYFRTSSPLRIRSERMEILNNASLLDSIETSQLAMNTFLNMFEDTWSSCTNRNDWRLEPYLEELDNNKERLVRIFNNYLYSTYGLGQRHSMINERIALMIRVLNVLGYDEYGVSDICEGLPEKIQVAALKTVLGEE